MTEGAGKEEGKGFKVEDRRRFSETGEAQEGSVSADKEESPAQDAGSQEGEVRPREPRDGGALPEINFSTFVISLSTQALVHLGEVPNPVGGKVERDLSMAKQMIDILGVLRDKTRGNLDQSEEKLLEDALYDLRIRYVEEVKGR